MIQRHILKRLVTLDYTVCTEIGRSWQVNHWSENSLIGVYGSLANLIDVLKLCCIFSLISLEIRLRIDSIMFFLVHFSLTLLIPITITKNFCCFSLSTTNILHRSYCIITILLYTSPVCKFIFSLPTIYAD